jgi:putative ABC transport system ATP-binding protein
MTEILKTLDVSKVYGSGSSAIKAVNGVSISIEAGEFAALVGPSGSGKTTMLAMLAGLLRATEGELFIDGEEIGQMSDRDRTRFRREKIGFTFQANNMLPYLTALENVELMLRLNGRYSRETHNQALELLERLGLGDRLNSLPAQLSGGQQQRVTIARSLIHNPSVVLADEQTASLDTERAFQVVEIFAGLIHEKQKAGIMVTHDLRMCRYVDKVIQMMDGEVVRVITDPVEIADLAGHSDFAKSPNKIPAEVPPVPQPVFPMSKPLLIGGD